MCYLDFLLLTHLVDCIVSLEPELINCLIQFHCSQILLICLNDVKQAENGLQSRSFKTGSVALWIEIAVILNWR